MAGIRIQHATRRSERFNFEDPRRPYPAPYHCPPPTISNGCGGTHLFKAVHLVLDDGGAAIVSREIWDRYGPLLGRHGFSLANEVAEPPAQTVRVPLARRIVAPRAPRRHTHGSEEQ